MTVVAHSGHWAIQVLYAAPVIGFLVVLAYAKLKERRERRLSDRASRD